MNRFISLLLLGAVIGHARVITGAVLIDTDITTTTWTLNDADGNPQGPYIIPESRAVLSGNTLTIEPGVEVVLGPGVRLSVEGNLLAIGTEIHHIRFVGVPPSEGNTIDRWDRILIRNPNGNSSQFRFCDVSDAEIGIHIYTYHNGSRSTTPIMKCRFRDCGIGVYGTSTAWAERPCNQSCPSPRAHEPHVDPVIQNCVFESTTEPGTGCEFEISGGETTFCCNAFAKRQAYGHSSPQIRNNVFLNLGSALRFKVGSFAGASSPSVVNNTVVDCDYGVVTNNPYDAQIRNNVFARLSAAAISRSGDLSKTVTHNCFDGNAQDFRGFSTNYGNVIWSNSRGIPSDLFSNIFEDPGFVDQETFLLSPGSPCVDSGCADSDCPIEAYNDVCVPPSRGTSISDIGAWGGPGACEMIPSAPVDTSFLRADPNFDLATDISDALTILEFLFIDNSAGTSCAKTMDVDDNSYLEITDAVFVLRYKFVGGTAPPAPFLSCGEDSTPDPLPCESAPHCP